MLYLDWPVSYLLLVPAALFLLLLKNGEPYSQIQITSFSSEHFHAAQLKIQF